MPSLLATAGVHHHLVRLGKRTRCALVIESGDAREVHHCALLLGYGAGAVNPYLAFETLDDMIRQRLLRGVTHEQAVVNYIHALNKGHPEGDVQDGHLHAPELLRRADLRGRRPRSRVRRSLLHAHLVAHRRRRRRGDRRGDRPAAPEGVRDAEPPTRTTSTAAASISGGATANTTSSTPRRCSSCSTRRAAVSTASSRSTPGWWTTRTGGSRRCAVCSS